MANFWKDFYETQKESMDKTKMFIKKHPIGYASLMAGSMAVGFLPVIAYKIKEKIEDENGLYFVIEELRYERKKRKEKEEDIARIKERLEDIEEKLELYFDYSNDRPGE